jgi:hypothetical protein
MNKKELIAAIVLLAAALEVEAVTKGLDETALKVLHDELSEKNEAKDKALSEQNTKNSQSKQEKVVLKFVAPHKRYANGDIAGFDADAAKSILALKPAVAKPYQEEKEQ